MTVSERLLPEFEHEMANTRRVLERIPEDHLTWKPHEKSMPLGTLAMHCATLPLFGAYILEDDSMDLADSKRAHADMTFKSRQNCLDEFDRNAARCRSLLAGADDDRLAAKWQFSYGPQVLSNESRSRTFRTVFFNHLVHHVAQLGVYLRLNDIPVPSLYGPSADEQWSPKK